MAFVVSAAGCKQMAKHALPGRGGNYSGVDCKEGQVPTGVTDCVLVGLKKKKKKRSHDDDCLHAARRSLLANASQVHVDLV